MNLGAKLLAVSIGFNLDIVAERLIDHNPKAAFFSAIFACVGLVFLFKKD